MKEIATASIEDRGGRGAGAILALTGSSLLTTLFAELSDVVFVRVVRADPAVALSVFRHLHGLSCVSPRPQNGG